MKLKDLINLLDERCLFTINEDPTIYHYEDIYDIAGEIPESIIKISTANNCIHIATGTIYPVDTAF